jgi:hypothetical protein
MGSLNKEALHNPQAGMIIEYGYSGLRGMLTITKVEDLSSGDKCIHYNDIPDLNHPDKERENGMLYQEGGWTLLLDRVINVRCVYFNNGHHDWEV